MLIYKTTFTDEALKLIEPGKAYDREMLARDVADVLANRLYEELGGIKAMSLKDVDNLKAAFFTSAMSLIDWTRCNRKVEPEEYADYTWRLYASKEELL